MIIEIVCFVIVATLVVETGFALAKYDDLVPYVGGVGLGVLLSVSWPSLWWP